MKDIEHSKARYIIY